MSEDVDFKIQPKSKEAFSKSRLKNELKDFRALIRSKVVLPELSVTNDVTRNEGKYQQITLKYPNLFSTDPTLRPDIKAEFTFANILLPTNELNVRTIIEDTLKDVSIFKSPSTTCISIDETAIEKWVALTRRVMAIERKYEDDDKTLIRHIYDLNAINLSNEVSSKFSEFAKTVIISDGIQFRNKHIEYASNPSHEIKQSLSILKNNPIWKGRYEEFIEAMVYNSINVTSYDEAINQLENFSTNVINNL